MVQTISAFNVSKNLRRTCFFFCISVYSNGWTAVHKSTRYMFMKDYLHSYRSLS